VTPQAAIARVADGKDLSEAEMAALMERVLDGAVSPAQLGALLMGLRLKGESVDELTGAARALRRRATPVPVPRGTVDTCGTGGDGARTFNVSTAAALVVAAAGVPVAKHGNRAISGAVGSADVLEALGVAVELPPAALGTCLETVGFAFLFAPALQPAMRHASLPRRELGIRTLFNLLGPLASPAGVTRQLVGVFDRRWVEPMAAALVRLGSERAWVVHGAGGLDELTLEGESLVGEVENGRVLVRTVQAGEAGLPSSPTSALCVASAAESAARVRDVLAGGRGPARDVVLLNAAAALVVAGVVSDLAGGAVRAASAIDAGRATALLARLVEFTTREAQRGA
jgi:anthranilate phosphoribosyltransferase